MSRTIDEKVVSMQFDNKNFERNVQTSLSTLDKLKKALHLDGAAKSLDNVNSSAKNFNMSGMSNAVEGVSSKFSALEVIGVTALANITNSAVNAGKELVKSLSIDQITSGWNKYEQKTASVQTLVNSTGKSLDEINGYLSKLMWFSDETSYSFTDMTSALSQMTSAGGDIDKLMPMITGIANATAFAGKGATEFASTIRNLGQSYSAGFLQLQDMKSLNLMGTSSKQLKEAFISVAESMGKIEKGSVTIQNFDETLKKKWADTEVMEAALGKFSELSEAAYKAVEAGQFDTAAEAIEALSGDYDELAVRAFKSAQEAKSFTEAIDATKDAVSSGWLQTFEIIFGNYEEAKNLWTDLANSLWDAFASGTEARNEMLQEWKDLGGRDALIESFWNAWEAVGNIITPIKEAFRDVFPAKTAEQLYNITEKVKELTGRFKEFTSKHAGDIKSAFKGIFSILGFLVDTIKRLGSGIGSLLQRFSGLSGGILGVAGAIGKWITSMVDSMKKADTLGKIIDGIVEILGKIGDKIASVFDSEGLNAFVDTVSSIFNGLKKIGSYIGSVLMKAIGSVKNAIGDVIDTLGVSGVIDTVKNIGITKIIFSISSLISNLVKKLKGSSSGFLDSIKGIADSFKSIFSGLSDALNSFTMNVKAKALKEIAIAIGILAVSLLVLSGIDKNKMTESLSAITVMFTELIVSMKSISKFGKTGSFIDATTSMISMSIAVLTLASAVKKLSDLDFNELGRGLTGVAGLMTIVVATMKTMSKGGNKTIKGATQMVILAASLKILASVCKDLSSFSWEEIGKGLSGIGGLLLELAMFSKMFNGGSRAILSDGSMISDKTLSSAAQIVTIAASLKILASVCKDFASFSWEEIEKGLAGVGGLLTEVAAFSRISSKSNNVIKVGLQLGIITLSMKSLAETIAKLGALSWSDIGKGIAAIAGSLMSMSIAMRLMPKDGVLDISFALPSIAMALEYLAEAMNKIAIISWDGIAKGLVSIVTILAALVIALRSMQGLAKQAFALVVLSTSLIVLAGAVRILSDIGIAGAAIAIASLATTLGILLLAVKLIAPHTVDILKLSVSLITFSAALAVFGASIAIVGTGLITFVSGFAASILMLSSIDLKDLLIGIGALASVFVVMGVAATLLKPLIPTIVSLAGSLILLSVSSLAVAAAISLIVSAIKVLASIGPEAVTTAVQSVGILLTGIVNMLPSLIQGLGDTIKQFIFTIIDVIKECAPAMVDGFFELIESILASLSQRLPAIVKNIAVTILETLKMFITYVPKMVEMLADFIITVLNSLSVKMPEMIAAIFNFLAALFDGVIQALGNVDYSTIIKAIAGIGLIAGVVAALGAVSGMVPSAMLGVLGVGAVIGELALVLAAIGALAQIPGLDWLINEGGKLLTDVGAAIGGMIGGFIGGIAAGIVSQLPGIATDLSTFMTNLAPFIEGAKSIDASMMDGVESLAKVILVLTAAEVLNGLTSWLTGGSSIADFAEEIVPLGEAIKKFSDKVVGIDESAVQAAANAGKMLGEMAGSLPKSGGVVSFFTGENDFDTFSDQIVKFGDAIVKFSKKVSGKIDEGAITAASNAGKILAEMAAAIPNTGGVAGFFAGENDIDDFGRKLISFGGSITTFSKKVTGNVDAEAIEAAANAGKMMIEMANTLPNTGGVVSWFTGDNKLDDFGEQLSAFGTSIVAFSEIISEKIDEDAVSAAANAGKMMAEMATTIPNSGGVVSFFAGDNDIEDFGAQLPAFGECIVAFSEKVSGRIDEDAILAAANAGKMMVEMASTLPNTGGVVSFFTGDTDMSEFGEQLPVFGECIAKFSETVSGRIDKESITAAANAGKMMVGFAETLPNSGGVISFFTGDTDMVSFGEQIRQFGSSMTSFSETVSGRIDKDAILAAANAGSIMVKLAETLPKTGGIVSWFTGDNTLDGFGEQLASFGEAMVAFSATVSGNIDEGAITAAANAGKMLVELQNGIPNTGGIVSWWSGDNDIDDFGESINEFGKAMVNFSSTLVNGGINLSAVETSVQACNKIIDLANNMQGSDFSIFKDFENSMSSLGTDVITNFTKAFKSGAPTMMSTIISTLDKSVKGATKALSAAKSKFNSSTREAMKGVSAGIKACGPGILTAIKTVVNDLINAIRSKKDSVTNAFKDLVSDTIDAVKTQQSAMTGAGKDLVQGLVNGIKDKKQAAYDAGYALGEAAVQGEKDGQKSHSPSKLTIQAGEWLGEGLVIGMENSKLKVYNSAKDLGKTAADGVTNPIKQSTTAMGIALGVVAKYGASLYFASDAYKAEQQAANDSIATAEKYKKLRKENQESLKANCEETAGLLERRLELEEAIEKAENKGTKAGDKRAKVLKKERDEVDQQIQSFNALKVAKREINDLDKENTKIDKKISKLESQTSDAKNKYKEAKNNIARLRDNLKEEKENLKIAKENIAKAKENLASENSSIDKAKDNITSAKSVLNDEKKNLDKSKENVNNIKKNIAEIKKNIAKEKENLADQKVNASDVSNINNQEIKNLKKKKKANDERKELLQGYVDTDAEYVEAINKETEACRSNVTYLDENIKYLDELKKKRDEYKKTLSSENEELERLTVTKTGLENILKVAAAGYIKLTEKETSDINANISAIDKQIAAQENKVATTEKNLKKTRTEIKKTTDLVESQTEELEKKLNDFYENLSTTIGDNVSKTLDVLSISYSNGISDIFSNNGSGISNIFEKASDEIDEAFDGYELLNNMQSQFDNVERWKERLTSLAGKLNEDIISKLRDLGPSSQKELIAFTTMTDEQLQKANDLFKKESEMSAEALISGMQSQIDNVTKWEERLASLAGKLDERLISKLRDLGPSSQKELIAFTTMTAEQLQKANEIIENESKMSGEALLKNYASAADKAKKWGDMIAQVALSGFDQSLIQEIGEKDIDSGMEFMEALLSLDESQIAEFNKAREEALTIPSDVSARVIAAYEYAGSDAAEAYRGAMELNLAAGAKTMGTALENGKNAIKKSTKKATDGVAEGIEASEPKVSNAVSSLLTSITTAIRKGKSSMKKAGKDLSQGLINGINNKVDDVYKAAYALGQMAVKGEMDGQQSHSPSRLMIKAGKFLGEGLVIGMDNMSSSIYKSGKSMGEDAVNSISDALETISKWESSDYDVTPTIRPVVDMSNLNATEIQLGANVNAFLTRPINSLSSIIADAQKVANDSNNEVINAIVGLRNDLNNLYDMVNSKESAFYVDSKKLASTMAKPMNRELSVLAKRGAY